MPAPVPVLDALARVRVAAANGFTMTNWAGSLVHRLFHPQQFPARVDLPRPGLYHFYREDGLNKARLHLRIEDDQSGMLLINASRVFHFNPSAATMAYLALSEAQMDSAIASIHKGFQVSRSQAESDYRDFVAQLDHILYPDGGCPACEMDLETIAPFSKHPSRPYRMDLALTYRCNNACDHCYNARSRSFPEMSTADWKRALDLLWQIGIPHVVFTGGEPTLCKDLPELIAHAEHNGQITGINTNGRRLKNPEFVRQLVDAGLDHVQITLESHDPAIHDRMVASPGAWQDTVAGLRAVLATRLYVMTNTTLLQQNAPHLSETLDFLADIGVPTLGLNALIYSGRGLNVDTGLPENALPPLLEIARAKTAQNDQRLIWYTPTEYCNFDPVQMELGVKGCTAALYNMCIEPDGAVLPCQSYYTPLGNILSDPWDKIWNHDLAVSLRERRNLPGKCNGCELLAECGGGCPLARLVQPAAV